MTDHTEIHRRLDSLETTIADSMNKLTQSVEKLVVLETEHHATRETLARYGAKLEKHDERLDRLELQQPRMTRFLDRWDKISLTLITTIVVACVLAVLGITYA